VFYPKFTAFIPTKAGRGNKPIIRCKPLVCGVILLEGWPKESNMLSPEEKLRLLSMVDILEPLSRQEIKELSRRIPDTHYQRGQLLYTPKERSEALFMLKQGRVRIYRVGHDGREFTLTVVGAGTVFGEMALTAQRLENAYAEATFDTTLTPLGTQYGATLCKPQKRKPPRYAVFASLCKPL
jgi:Cyclic nucleotide-binding domain